MYLNRVTLIGFLGQDARRAATQEGREVAPCHLRQHGRYQQHYSLTVRDISFDAASLEEVVTPKTVLKGAMASKLSCYETRRLSLAMGR
jgi:hypothetical protein